MYKAVFYIIKGLLGISLNENLSLIIKLYLYLDYFRLLLIAFRYIFFAKRRDSDAGGVFYSKAFDYTMHYPIFPAFFFIFNEIYCIGVYPVAKNLKNYIDLGANIGLTVLWYHFFYPDIVIFAFEPDEHNFKYLKTNIEEAQVKNCHLIQKALSNKIGSHKFYRLLDPVQNLDSGLTLNQDLLYDEFTVKTTKVSILIRKIKKVSLIKMDIEGGEYDVFKDIFTDKAINSVERIFFESHTPDKESVKSFLSTSNKLKNIGVLSSKHNSKTTSMNYWESSR